MSPLKPYRGHEKELMTEMILMVQFSTTERSESVSNLTIVFVTHENPLSHSSSKLRPYKGREKELMTKPTLMVLFCTTERSKSFGDHTSVFPVFRLP